MNGDIPPLHLEQLLQLLKSWLDGHDCHSEQCLIESLTFSALAWIKAEKKSKASLDLDTLHDEFVGIKTIHESKRHRLKSNVKLISRKIKSKVYSRRTNINKLLIVFKNLSWIPPSIETLHDFHEYCCRMDYIKCDFNKFRIHFHGLGKPVDKLIWYGTTKELGRLFGKLKRSGIIEARQYIQRLHMHFILPGNVQLNQTSLSSSASYPIPNGIDESMDSIVRKIKATLK